MTRRGCKYRCDQTLSILTREANQAVFLRAYDAYRCKARELQRRLRSSRRRILSLETVKQPASKAPESIPYDRYVFLS